MYHGVKQGDNLEIQNAVFSKRKTSQNYRLFHCHAPNKINSELFSEKGQELGML